MKKLIVTFAIALLISINTLPVVAASEIVVPTAISQDTVVSPLAEQTVWYNRIYNGMLQKRLWSITYGEWLTDWIDVAPVE